VVGEVDPVVDPAVLVVRVAGVAAILTDRLPQTNLRKNRKRNQTRTQVSNRNVVAGLSSRHHFRFLCLVTCADYGLGFTCSLTTRFPLVQTPVHRKRQPPRAWLIPAIVAAILFIGGVSGNLIANYVQTSLDPYRRWVWITFGVALIVAIAVAIRESLRAMHSPASSAEPNAEGERRELAGDVVARDKITHIHGAVSPAATALHQLPPPVSDFTGRASELAELMAKLEQGGITISGLHGLGGIGKTALALKLADQLKARYPDAQFYLDLKGASSEPLAVAEALAHVIRSYHPTAKLPDTQAALQGLYQSVLQDQRALLLMDNAASAEQVEPLTPPAGCVLLVTSRQHFTLPGLFAKNLEALSPEDARKLLLAIAPRVGDLADEIARLCGYLPLALRLAGSALVKFVNLTPADYARRLQDGQRRLELIEASLNLSGRAAFTTVCVNCRRETQTVVRNCPRATRTVTRPKRT
jgi:hypothetical protein